MVVAFQEFLLVIVGSIVLSLVILAVSSPPMRQVRRLVLVGVATAIGILVWNVGLNVTGASGLNVDSDMLGLSVQDVGSGVLAFIAVLLALTLGARGLPTSRTPDRRGDSRPGNHLCGPLCVNLAPQGGGGSNGDYSGLHGRG